jgi:hypothetical protein
VRDIYADGDTVITLFDAAATAADGLPYRNTYTWYFWMTNGKVAKAIGSSSIVADDWQLPWGNANSLQFVVFNSKAVIVPLAIAIDDSFGGKHANVALGAAVHGEYFLCLTSICSEAKKSRLTVLWSYRVPSTSTPGPFARGSFSYQGRDR